MPIQPLHVAFIDDGIDRRLYPTITNSLAIDEDTLSLRPYQPPTKKAIMTHGAYCMKIFQHYCRHFDHILLSSIDVILAKQKGNIDFLQAALMWCIDNKVDVINLSLGSTAKEDRFTMYRITRKAKKAGCIIVAANKNAPIRTYPSCFRHVIGVQCDSLNQLKVNETMPIPKDPLGLNYIAHIDTTIIEEDNTLQSNSLATPMVTAKVVDYLIEMNASAKVKELKRCI